eukprot:TRINITY_DN6828_c0_g1_i1.p3 TRINITY_DN6828_c0_g1~~TRINITY_DN6828_c0_g1_i1.p3  ORF type:complete len:205 (+),score=85.85 TRINITY_DN6828_c0_g1_i1:88-615(+)
MLALAPLLQHQPTVKNRQQAMEELQWLGWAIERRIKVLESRKIRETEDARGALSTGTPAGRKEAQLALRRKAAVQLKIDTLKDWRPPPPPGEGPFEELEYVAYSPQIAELLSEALQPADLQLLQPKVTAAVAPAAVSGAAAAAAAMGRPLFGEQAHPAEEAEEGDGVQPAPIGAL